MDQYLKFSKIVREIYMRYSSEVEAFGIDESWIELTGAPLLKERTPHEIADEIRNTVKSEVGLTVSIGISFNKIFAKLGSDMKKPDAVTEIGRDTFRDQVWPLPVSDLLYMAVLDDEISRRELEGLAEFPPKKESLQYKYHLFLELNRKRSCKDIQQEISRLESHLNRLDKGEKEIVDVGF